VLLELKAENLLEVKTYFNAAKPVQIFEEDSEEIARQGRLKDMKGDRCHVTPKTSRNWSTLGSSSFAKKTRDTRVFSTERCCTALIYRTTFDHAFCFLTLFRFVFGLMIEGEFLWPYPSECGAEKVNPD
jgi:hypothetical protein